MREREPRRRSPCTLAAYFMALATAPAVASEPPAGDWAGWLYGDGFDAPLRLHLSGDEGDLTGAVTFTHLGSEPLPFESVRRDGTELRLERTNSQGRPQQWTGVVDGEALRGAVTVAGEPLGTFEVHRSPVPLPPVEPAGYAAAAGVYRFPSGRSVVLTPWFWGEMRYLDTASGRYGTLFATTADTLFAGSAMYVPGPVTAHVTLRRAPGGDVTDLAWRDVDGAESVGRRVPLAETEIAFENGEIELSGTLITPGGAGPHPAVVVLGGSGWSTRESVRFEATVIVSMGFAALIYDKRGFGDSGGERTVPFATTAADAVAAVRHLRARPEIDAERVGLTGRSRGGWIAPLAASSSSDVAFLVLFVPPAVSPAAQETTRRLNRLRDTGAGERDLAEASAYLDRQWAYARTGEGWEAYHEMRCRVEERGWLDELGGPGTPDPDAWAWARMNMFHDPVPALERVTVPVLALFGGADSNVVPELNRPVMAAALERAGNDRATLLVVPGANHGLRLADDGNAPLHRQQGYAPELWSIVRDWLERVRSP